MLVSFRSVSWVLVALTYSVPIYPKWYKRTAVSSSGDSGFLLLCFCMCESICLCLYVYVYVCLSLSLSLCQCLYVVCLCMSVYMHMCLSACLCVYLCREGLSQDLNFQVQLSQQRIDSQTINPDMTSSSWDSVSMVAVAHCQGPPFFKSSWFYRQPFPVNETYSGGLPSA